MELCLYEEDKAFEDFRISKGLLNLEDEDPKLLYDIYKQTKIAGIESLKITKFTKTELSEKDPEYGNLSEFGRIESTITTITSITISSGGSEGMEGEDDTLTKEIKMDIGLSMTMYICTSNFLYNSFYNKKSRGSLFYAEFFDGKCRRVRKCSLKIGTSFPHRVTFTGHTVSKDLLIFSSHQVAISRSLYFSSLFMIVWIFDRSSCFGDLLYVEGDYIRFDKITKVKNVYTGYIVQLNSVTFKDFMTYIRRDSLGGLCSKLTPFNVFRLPETLSLCFENKTFTTRRGEPSPIAYDIVSLTCFDNGCKKDLKEMD